MTLPQVFDLLEARGLLARAVRIEAEGATVVLVPGQPQFTKLDAPALSKGELEKREQFEHDYLEADLYAASEGWR